MAGALVGGAFLSASLQVLFDRLASRDFINFFKRQKLDGELLEKLEITLLVVNEVLNDAEEKQMTNPAVKRWLDKLKDAIYDADDLLDDITTEASRCKLEDESHTNTDQVQNIISTFNPFNEGINSKIARILVKLEFIAKQKKSLGLKEVVREKSPQKLPTTSLVNEFDVYGRDDDREQIIKSLLSDDASGNEIGVITIVGMGGVGKTTLAQLVYNDDKVKKHFDLKIWVCVSEEFDVLRVTKTIFEAPNSSTCDIKDLNMLQVKLKESFTGKKFFLVLDDIWNENSSNWGVLQKPFRYGAKGSKILVTTRNEGVASIMRTVPTHHLKHLQDKDCWLLFSKHAFDNGNSSTDPNLEVIGREIVKKCKGLPLAAKTLGGLLRFKQDVGEWNKILKSEIWDFPNDKSNILPALRLSYHYLPPHLKQCFAYCSIFPKDYKFKKQKLVLLWMAEDLLQHPNRNKRLEEVGDENFDDLVSRSFFQRLGGYESCFIMHDLVNDLAQFISGEFCYRLEGDSSHKIPEKTRHLSYCRAKYDPSKIFEEFCDAKCLRTFLLLPPFSLMYDSSYLTNKVPHDLLPTLCCLRVLSLSQYNSISKLPESIGSLKHLRYVDLSFSAIRRLPASTITLFNLQTLLLSYCRGLIELPMDMWKLINLRHLNISGTNLKEMPRHMGRLRSLQTLSTFVVGRHNGSMITELRELQHLRGKLHIRDLQNVVHAWDAFEANLMEKEYIDTLMLEWSTNSEDSQNERDVLDKLQPHANLKELTIKYYGGTRFPNWLGDHWFCNMVYLRLINCRHCFSLPPLGQLPCLKHLSIVGFDIVERVGFEFYKSGSSAIKPFGSLEILRFEKMPEWVEWFCFGDEGGEFPCLRVLYIKECPKLNGGLPSHLPSLTKLYIFKCQQLVVSLPRAPAIRELYLEDSDKMMLRSNDELTLHPSSHVSNDQMTTLPNRVGLQQLSSIEILKVSDISQLKELPPRLRELRITRCDALESLPEGMIHINTCLHDLDISFCPSLKSFPKGGLPATLKSLRIETCRELELFSPEETMHNYCASLESLSRLQIGGCPKLISFPKGGLPTPNLTLFQVNNCKNLKSLPERIHILLPSLQHLIIYGCPKLESFPEGGLPSNLISLSVSNCDKLMAGRMEWGLQRLVSLKKICIRGCGEVESFPEEWLLPSTLTSLEIWYLPNLKYLDKRGLQHLTSLEKLKIWGCPKLQSLPEEGLPASLSSLAISSSPLLEQRCQRERGEDWPKIARIPSILINGGLVAFVSF